MVRVGSYIHPGKVAGSQRLFLGHRSGTKFVALQMVADWGKEVARVGFLLNNATAFETHILI